MRGLVPTVIAFAVGALLLVIDPLQMFRPAGVDIDAIRGAVEGTWELRTPEQTIAFTVRQADHEVSASRSWIRSAAACGPHDRVLIRRAEACKSETSMPLEVHVAGEDIDAAGRYTVRAPFDGGDLKIRFGEQEIYAHVDAMGVATDAWGAGGRVALVRTKR